MHPPAHALYMNQNLKADFTVKEGYDSESTCSQKCPANVTLNELQRS
jgi:hypothetical protein